MVKKSIYKGGTFDTDISNGFSRTDADLIKMDIKAHLFTKKGERLMMPNFGTNIHKLLFENLDDLLKQRLAEEIQSVINYDPRVELLSLAVIIDEDNHTISAQLLLRFIELEVVDTLNLEFPTS